MANTQTLGMTGGNSLGFNHFAPFGFKSGRGEQSPELMAHSLQNAACVLQQACELVADNREFLLLAGTAAGFTGGALIMALDICLTALR